jgi:hypothetical protein
MSTYKQQQALNKMVENGGNVGQAMRDVGYSKNTAKTPQKLTESQGFISLCEDKGLTDDLLINALVEDIKIKKGNRRAELELAFKIKGKLTNRFDINENKPLSIMFDRSFLGEEEKEDLLNLLKPSS